MGNQDTAQNIEKEYEKEYSWLVAMEHCKPEKAAVKAREYVNKKYAAVVAEVGDTAKQ